jgi:hypothetical protein
MRKVLVNLNQPIMEGEGVTFDLDLLADYIRLKRVKSGKGKSNKYIQTYPMVDLLERISPRITGVVSACLVPDQDYIDLHWLWTGFIRNGSPVVNFINKEFHVALALWSLWQGHPTIAKGPCRRMCESFGCVNPHHYHYAADMVQPVRMTFSLVENPSLAAAERMVKRASETLAMMPKRDVRVALEALPKEIREQAVEEADDIPPPAPPRPAAPVNLSEYWSVERWQRAPASIKARMMQDNPEFFSALDKEAAE